jgi:uncharacterized protein (DUF2126 family)
VCGWEVPLELAGQNLHGEVLVGAVRYRAYLPTPGLHLGLAPHDPLELVWEQRGARTAIRLHAWQPGGGPYPGLPGDAEEARLRRSQRVVPIDDAARPLRPPPASVPGRPTLDLRRLPPDFT